MSGSRNKDIVIVLLLYFVNCKHRLKTISFFRSQSSWWWRTRYIHGDWCIHLLPRSILPQSSSRFSLFIVVRWFENIVDIGDFCGTSMVIPPSALHTFWTRNWERFLSSFLLWLDLLWKRISWCCSTAGRFGIFFPPKRGKGWLSQVLVGRIIFFLINNFWVREGI